MSYAQFKITRNTRTPENMIKAEYQEKQQKVENYLESIQIIEFLDKNFKILMDNMFNV